MAKKVVKVRKQKHAGMTISAKVSQLLVALETSVYRVKTDEYLNLVVVEAWV